MAPEVLGQERATRASDVWSFGVLLFELANNGDALPYATLSNAAVVAAVREGRRLGMLGDAPAPDSEEARLMQVLREPVDWVPLT